jgi:hypothetical protein
MTVGNRAYLADVTPDSPMHERPRAHACVLMSPNYPDADGEEAALIKRLIRFVLTTPVEIGAGYQYGLTEGAEDPDWLYPGVHGIPRTPTARRSIGWACSAHFVAAV